MTETAAATAIPVGLVSPASIASPAAHSHLPVSTAYRLQAASAVSSASVYPRVSTTECGSTAHSATSSSPPRGPSSRSPILYTPTAASAAAVQATSSAAAGVPPASPTR
ncbi:hypothetical protein GCM10020254_41650 [Streptomyces goshikiensis]